MLSVLKFQRTRLIKKLLLLVFLYSLLIPIEARAVSKDQWIRSLAICESGGRDITILDSNHKYSIGILQFQSATFLSFSKKYGMKVTIKDIHSSTTQATLAKHMLDDGLWKHWYTCSKKITKKLGSYKEATDI